MLRILLIIFSVVLFPAIASSASAHHSDIDWKKGKWGDLGRYIGLYDYKPVLQDPRIHAELLALLGKAELEHLIKNLNVKGPIGFDGDCLVLEGNAPHQGEEENAFVNVCLYKGAVNAAILSREKIKIYTRLKVYRYLPTSIKRWIYATKNYRTIDNQPDHVEMSSVPIKETH